MSLISVLTYFVIFVGKPESVSSLVAAKLENAAALEKFGRKQRSLLQNQGNQCYATTPLHYLLSIKEIRSEVLLRVASDTPQLGNYLTKLHLNENATDHVLHRLVGMLDERFLNSKVHHDADEFLIKLLEKLELPNNMFEVLRRLSVRCATPGCSKEMVHDDQKLGKF